ncbi:DapH/DapD/GlmU-related protein [Sphingobacterium hungaricum]
MIRDYSILGYLYLAYCKFRGFFVFANSRIIRFPIDIRGRSYIEVSNGFTTGKYCRIEAYPKVREKVLFFGENFEMNDNVHITSVEKVEIGKNVLIASKVYISDCSHGSYSGDEFDSSPSIPPKERNIVSKPVIIEDNVWIGEFVSVLPGVTIGKGSIIGANSVVSRSIPPFVIAVGAPAKPIKEFNFDTGRWEALKK